MPLPHPAPGDRKWWVIGTVGIALAVALITWLTLLNTLGQVTPTVTGYHVVDDATVRVDFDVHRPEGTSVRCTVQALDSGFSVVGTLGVDIPASQDATVHESVTIRTASRAVTGTVDTCVRTGSANTN